PTLVKNDACPTLPDTVSSAHRVGSFGRSAMSRSARSILSWEFPVLVSGIVMLGFGPLALAALDKYTVAVPGGLAFSEFKGYEQWEFISMSHGEKVLAAIVGNPTMIEAFKSGIPGNGKPFPDGAKMAKIHWIPTKMEGAP